MTLTPNPESPTLGALEADLSALKAKVKRMNETSALEKSEREANLRELRRGLRLLPRKELYSLLDKAESDGDREMLRDAIEYQTDIFSFANNLETARAIWRICPTLVMASEYPQALKEDCRAASEWEKCEVDQEAYYFEDAAFESGLLPKLSGKDIDDAFKASLPKLMEELAESQPD